MVSAIAKAQDATSVGPIGINRHEESRASNKFLYVAFVVGLAKRTAHPFLFPQNQPRKNDGSFCVIENAKKRTRQTAIICATMNHPLLVPAASGAEV